MDGTGSVVETLAQDWSSMDRERQYECAGGHKRSYAQLDRPCGQNGLQRNLREGLEMPRPSMVEIETTPLERSGERQMVWPTPTAIQNLPAGGHGCWGGLQVHWKCRWSVGQCPGQYGLVAFCSKPWKLEAVLEMWKEPCVDGPPCLGDPSTTGTDAGASESTERGYGREWFGVHLVPLSLYQANCDIALMSSWLAGFGWQRVWTSTWLLEWKFRGRLVLRDVQNGPSEMWHESVELECGWRCVLVVGF